MDTCPSREIQKLIEIVLHPGKTQNQNEGSREIQEMLCSELLSWYSNIWSGRDPLGPTFSQRREEIGSYQEGSSTGLASVFQKLKRVKANKESNKDALKEQDKFPETDPSEIKVYDSHGRKF